MERHNKLTRLERLPRAIVYWTVHIIGIPLFVAMIPLAFAWCDGGDCEFALTRFDTCTERDTWLNHV